MRKAKDFTSTFIVIFSGIIFFLAYIFCYQLVFSSRGESASSEFLNLRWTNSTIGRGYILSQVLMCAEYGLMIYWASKGYFQNKLDQTLIWIVPFLIGLVGLPLVPMESIDILSYTAHGYLGTIPGGNPMVQPLSTIKNSNLGLELKLMGWDAVHPQSCYGSFFTYLEILAYRLAHSGFGTMVLLKLVSLLSFLGTGYFLRKIAEELKNANPTVVCVLFMWNPLLVHEFGFEGHVDSSLTFWGIAALYYTLNKQRTPSIWALAASVLMKYVTLLFAPAQVIYTLRSGKLSRSQLWQFIAMLGFVVLVSCCSYLPFWEGVKTFRGGELHFDDVSNPWATHWVQLRFFLGVAFILIYGGFTALFVKTERQLCATYTTLICVFFFFVSPKLYPWYFGLLIALFSLGGFPADRFLLMIYSLFGLCLSGISSIKQIFSKMMSLEIYHLFAPKFVLGVCGVLFIASRWAYFFNRAKRTLVFPNVPFKTLDHSPRETPSKVLYL